jgi:RNA polymerase sigma factor for flagellar operon FliA
MKSPYVRVPQAFTSESAAPGTVSGRAHMTDPGNGSVIRGQDDSERERLLVEQLPQVRYIARRIHERLPRHVLLEDMVHAGVVGLIDALHKFDGSKHVQFSSYAKFRIRGAILDSLREMDWSPRDLRRKARRLEEAHNTLRSTLGHSPSEIELAAELGISLRSLQSLLGEISGLELGSLRVESPLDGHEQDLCEYLPDDSEETPLFLCLRSEMTHLLSRAIADLPERERQVLSLYYYEELTMKEAGLILGLGESRVSQIHSMAVIRLRARLAELSQKRPSRDRAGSRRRSAVKPSRNKTARSSVLTFLHGLTAQNFFDSLQQQCCGERLRQVEPAGMQQAFSGDGIFRICRNENSLHMVTDSHQFTRQIAAVAVGQDHIGEQ